MKRRLDITLERLEAEFNALPEAVRAELMTKPWVATLEMVGRLRGMEMAEEEVRPFPEDRGLANIYDRVAVPGENGANAVLRAFRVAYGNETGVHTMTDDTFTPAQAALLRVIEAEARRIADMYPQSSDGRNTFVIFADWVASLAAQPPSAQEQAAWAINGAHEFAAKLRGEAAAGETWHDLASQIEACISWRDDDDMALPMAVKTWREVIAALRRTASHSHSSADTGDVDQAGARALVLENARLREELAEITVLFDLQAEADRRAVSAWKKAHPDKFLTSPDRCDMVVWLMEEFAKVRAERDQLRDVPQTPGTTDFIASLIRDHIKLHGVPRGVTIRIEGYREAAQAIRASTLSRPHGGSK